MKCATCKFCYMTDYKAFLMQELVTIKKRMCGRYPRHVEVTKNHWCGEYKEKE